MALYGTGSTVGAIITYIGVQALSTNMNVHVASWLPDDPQCLRDNLKAPVV